MKRNQINKIFNVQADRQRSIMTKVICIVICSLVVIGLIALTFVLDKKQYVNYEEKSQVDYNVFLKNNEFYEDNHMDKDKEYVVSLIDYIVANFEYELNLDNEDVNFDYTYKIDAVLDIRTEDSDNFIYEKVDTLVDEVYVDNYTSNSLTLSKNVNVDYVKYNDIVKNFVKVYDLDDIDASLTVRMYINILDNCIDGKYVNEDSDYTIELDIPLNTKTIDISMNSDVVDYSNNLMICDNNNDNVIFAVFVAIVLIIALIIYLVVNLVCFIIKTRTPQTVYERELRKILTNYKSYIQKINTIVDFNAYKVLKVDTFVDMLEIHDTVQQPILMSEDKYNRGTYFMIPTNTKILYVYGLKVNDIRKEMNKNSD